MNYQQTRKGEAGFTLVELAIVMVIIGLLIGGILKGQELIANAKVTGTIGQINGIDAAISTFRDKYGVLPGDMNNPLVRIANCTGSCAAAGNGDGRIGGLASVQAIPAGENLAAFGMLAASDLLSSIDPNGLVSFGQQLPAGRLGGGMWMGFDVDGLIAGFSVAADPAQPGHYITYTGSPLLAAGVANAGVVTTGQAAAIDRKMDDGLPGAGTVRGDQTGGGNACRVAAGAGGIYDEAAPGLCGLIIRTQG